MTTRRRDILLWILLLAALPARLPAGPQPTTPDGYPISQGAAPGYVPDRACADCHQDIAESFREVSMSRAFFRPGEQPVIEKGGPFFHEASGRWYEMRIEDGRYTFRRYLLDDKGKPIHELELPVDWILGSGSRSRTYLVRTPIGELYQLPLAWYTQGEHWGMAPGFDRPDHLGVTRRVRRECMFCHNAYPEMPAGSDHFDQPHVYPQELPRGIGCQRCHGPGAEHVRRAVLGEEESGRFVVNPATLTPKRQRDVCYQCHMQPSVSIIGVRRFGLGTFSYQPGQPLGEYQPGIDVKELGKKRHERFEINHHPYRLEQSRCFLESDGKLSCTSCHDPHRKVPPERRAAHYRSACLQCHTLGPEGPHPVDMKGDCTSCHMPERRTHDVVQVMVTDHMIRSRPRPRDELTAPREEETPVLVGAHFLDPEEAPKGALGEVYGALGVVRAGPADISVVKQLWTALRRTGTDDLEPYIDLAQALLAKGATEQAVKLLEEQLERHPEHPLVLERLGMAQARAKRFQEGIATLRRAVAAGPRRREPRHNLGVLLSGTGKPEEALPHLEAVVEAHPLQSLSWYYLGRVRRALGKKSEAAAAYRRALAVDPTHERSAKELAELEKELGR